jgi:hypothetical protein
VIGKRGDGVLLAAKDSVKTEPTDFVSDSLELASIVINSSSKKVLVNFQFQFFNHIRFHYTG